MKRYFLAALLIIMVCSTSVFGGQEEIVSLDDPAEVSLDNSIEIEVIETKKSSILFRVKIKTTNISDNIYKQIKMYCILYDDSGDIISTEDGYILDAVLFPNDYQFHEFLFRKSERLSDIHTIGFKVVVYKKVFGAN